METRPDSPEEPMVARDATYYRAPDAVRERIRAAIAAESFGQVSAPRPRPAWWGWVGAAGAAAAAAVLSWNVALMRLSAGAEQELARDVTAAHVRSLMLASHLNDVASTDQHTVKPWFEGKIDFAPRVEELASCGFPLIGGRLDYLDGRAVAAMTYRRRLHVVNLFEWPVRQPSRELQVMSLDGYSIARWSANGLQYWAVSDVAEADIREFARCLRGA